MVTWAAGAGGRALGQWVDVICGSSTCSGPGMACRSWWYWSGVAWDESVEYSFVGLGESAVGLVGEASLVIGAGWQGLILGSGVGDKCGGDVWSRLMGSGGCWLVCRHRQSSRVE